ncbi:hypothetical protein [Desulfosporosinus sp. BG]|uniref:hypothetical protein n=1 Tax=Desulfosporosinus sp. BG TaxID=1633135 RepID=UPI0008564144|nr:hypothetical protein [Desulfosporosinus sp. BG]ODA41931.1 hypothetical protein DSBG_1201 [Desulfosporosinus sp. BG]
MEAIVDVVIKVALAGVHAAQQLCNIDQLTQDVRYSPLRTRRHTHPIRLKLNDQELKIEQVV